MSIVLALFAITLGVGSNLKQCTKRNRKPHWYRKENVRVQYNKYLDEWFVGFESPDGKFLIECETVRDFPTGDLFRDLMRAINNYRNARFD